MLRLGVNWLACSGTALASEEIRCSSAVHSVSGWSSEKAKLSASAAAHWPIARSPTIRFFFHVFFSPLLPLLRLLHSIASSLSFLIVSTTLFRTGPPLHPPFSALFLSLSICLFLRNLIYLDGAFSPSLLWLFYENGINASVTEKCFEFRGENWNQVLKTSKST